MSLKNKREEFIDCCNTCGNKRYAKYKPFRELGAITMAMTECKLCNGNNVKEHRPIIYAIDWATMCRKIDYFD